MRFIIRDKKLVNEEKIKELDLVQGINWNGNEFQIIVGNGVAHLYDNVVALDKESKKNKNEFLTKQKKEKKKESGWKRFLGAMGAIMQPAIPMFIVAGLLLGLKTVFVETGVIQKAPLVPTLQDINAMPVFDAVFWGVSEVGLKFLAIFIGYNTMKYFGGNLVMSIFLGLAIANPLLLNASWHLFYLGKIDIKVQTYNTSILPLIAANICYFYLDKNIKKIMPKSLDMIFRPLISFVVVVFGTYFILGPILNIFEHYIAEGAKYLGEIPYGIGTMILAMFWEPLVLTGSHIVVGLVLSMGVRGAGGEFIPSILLPAIMYGSYGQLGALFAVMMRTKNKKLKEYGAANILPGLMPITEPIVYGVNLPMVLPFVAGCLGAGVGGLFSGLVNVQKFSFGGFGIFGILSYWNDNAWNIILFLISCLISIGASLLICLALYQDRHSEKKEIKDVNKILIKYCKLINEVKFTSKEKTTLAARTHIDPDLKLSIKEVEKLYNKYDSNKVEIEKINNHKKITASMKRELILLETQNREYKKLIDSKEVSLNELQNNLLEGIKKMLEGLALYFGDDNFLLFVNNYFNAIYSLQIVYHRMDKKEDVFNYKTVKKTYNLERKALLAEEKELKKALA